MKTTSPKKPTGRPPGAAKVTLNTSTLRATRLVLDTISRKAGLSIGQVLDRDYAPVLGAPSGR